MALGAQKSFHCSKRRRRNLMPGPSRLWRNPALPTSGMRRRWLKGLRRDSRSWQQRRSSKGKWQDWSRPVIKEVPFLPTSMRHIPRQSPIHGFYIDSFAMAIFNPSCSISFKFLSSRRRSTFVRSPSASQRGIANPLGHIGVSPFPKGDTDGDCHAIGQSSLLSSYFRKDIVVSCLVFRNNYNRNY